MPLLSDWEIFGNSTATDHYFGSAYISDSKKILAEEYTYGEAQE